MQILNARPDGAGLDRLRPARGGRGARHRRRDGRRRPRRSATSPTASIEEFMIAANEAVAYELVSREVPALYRVHARPRRTRLEELRELLATVRPRSSRGSSTSCHPSALQEVLREVAGHAGGGVRLLGRAAHHAAGRLRSANAWGHYALASRVLHPLHLAHPALPGPGRPPPAPRAAARPGGGGDGAHASARAPAGDGRAHEHHGAAGGAVGARPAAMEEGALPGRPGRRDLPGQDHGRPALRPLRPARRLLRRRPGADPHHGATTSTATSPRPTGWWGSGRDASSGWPTPSRSCWSAPRRRPVGWTSPSPACPSRCSAPRGGGRPRSAGPRNVSRRSDPEKSGRGKSARGGNCTVTVESRPCL